MNDAFMDDWADAHNPNNDDYIGGDDDYIDGEDYSNYEGD